jgi:transposase
MSQKFESAISVIGIDIGKNSFHVVGHDERGAIVLRQKWSRGQVEARLANMPPCLIGMEACVGAHHLSRKLGALGHDARLMPAKYVRPYSKGQKNDFRDAEAIAEAVQRPTMKFVATKTADQLDLQALHRVRERLVSQCTGIINQIRAFLLERGIAMRQGQRYLRTGAVPGRQSHEKAVRRSARTAFFLYPPDRPHSQAGVNGEELSLSRRLPGYP